MRSLRLLAYALCLPAAVTAAQDVAPIHNNDFELIRDLDLRCKTPQRTYQELEALTAALPPSDCNYNNTNTAPAYDPTFIYDIPVVVHVIRTSSGATGNISATQVQNQIDILNEDFRAIAGTNGAGGVDTMIQFHLATEDPGGSPTTGITYSNNTTWYNDGGSYWNSLAWDTNRYLNIYTNTAGGALGYVPDLPQGGIAGSNSDRVVVYWQSFGRNSPFFPYHQGRTTTHEVGHYLGLYHTFDNGCGTVAGCATTGDRICDTNRESSPSYGCPGSASSCSSADPFRNYMNYTDDLCMTNFTADQANRMRCTLEFYRPSLASACASVASATFRNAGTNAGVYQVVTPPVIGGSLGIFDNMLATGHTFSLVFGFGGTLDLTLGAGQRLLVDITHPSGEMLSLSPSATGVHTLPIPVDLGLCGMPVFTQAIHYGGTFPFALTNAQDLVVGL